MPIRLGDVPGVANPRGPSPSRAISSPAHGAERWRRGVCRFRCYCAPRLPYRSQFHPGGAGGRIVCGGGGLPGDELLVIEYLDARGDDGNARKYRVMMVGGQIYPLHLAISRNWKVHYFTSDMADKPDHRREEARFLADMPAALGDKAMTALEQIRDVLGLDYAGSISGLVAIRRSVAVRGQCHHGDRRAGHGRALGLSAHGHQHASSRRWSP